MAQNTTAFFQEIAKQGIDSRLRGINGTCKFDIAGAGVWYVTINDGELTVTGQNPTEDGALFCDVEVFDKIVRGEENAYVMQMQGRVKLTGKLVLFQYFMRLVPPPPSTKKYATPPIPDHPVQSSEAVVPSLKEGEAAPTHKVPPPQTVSILEGNTFVVSDRAGDIDALPTDTQGLFSWDTRFLSRWLLTVNGISPRPLSTDDINYYACQFFLVPSTGTVYVDAKLSVVRTREVGHGFQESITILNHANKPVDLDVALDVGADFADSFEVKDALAKKGSFYQKVEDNRLVLGYRRDTYNRETWIESDANPTITEHQITYKAHIEPHEQWTANISVIVAMAGMGETHTSAQFDHNKKLSMQKNLEGWLEGAPRLQSKWEPLQQIYQRSIIDLAALRFYPLAAPGEALPAAGLPWFMTIFGRDSIITSLQALPFTPDLAETTLRVLAARQGSKVDDFRDEEPGKIIHEVRYGEMTAFEERPQSPYYGAADVTPLFLVLLDEFERWSGKGEMVRDMEFAARSALDWIDHYGDRDGDGYVEYNRRNKETGLENQCWKDSWDSILFADGTLSKLPRATCEIQGYVYDAKVRCARLARQFWNDPALATRLEKEAAELKQRFNRDYWLPDRQYFALAIDGDGRKVDALTSNIGHLLWSGIVDDDKVPIIVNHLMGERLFSGWGVRTMAEGDGGYNPIGYHVGTVWPHDCSIVAMGLMRQGYRQEAAQIAMGVFEAATFFRNRLPEAFAGYARDFTEYPVEYPTACSPQAWATGAPLLMLRAIMGLEPMGEKLLVDAHLPAEIENLGIFDIPGRWGRTDAFARHRPDNLSADGNSAHQADHIAHELQPIR